MKYNSPLASTVLFAALALVSVIFWWNPLRDTLSLALSNDAYTHILLIVPLSIALIFTGSKHINRKPLPDDSGVDCTLNWILPALALALALTVGGYARLGMPGTSADLRLALAISALVVWWIASLVLSFGTTTFRALVFPLCLLFLIVPIPEHAVSWIVESLQYHSASTARVMFQMLRIPVTQEGVMLYIPNLGIEVARECSSIRSSSMLVLTTLILAHLFLRSWWRQALLVAAAIPLSVAKNGLRIVTIGTLGTRVDPGFLDGKLHHHGGIIFFAVAVAAVVLLLLILRRTEILAPVNLSTLTRRL